MDKESKYFNNNYENLKCIWMSSHVIDYKLCNNQFDCENCLFDKVIRNLIHKEESQLNETENILDAIFNKLQNIKYDDKIVYLKNNLIAKEICYNTFYLGINPIFNCFLDSNSSLIINENVKNVTTGQKIIEFSGAWGTYDLSSPMNLLLYDKVAEKIDNFSSSQWFAIIGVDNNQLHKAKLYLEDWDNMYTTSFNIIERIKSQIPQIGNTMLDGGIQIKYLYQLVGAKKYLDILNALCT